MTAQEQQMIQNLADRINNTPLAEKDPDAEQFLQQALGRNPDALYILAQTVLVQGYALEQAQKQLADAKAQGERQAPEPKHATSFLGNLLGLGGDDHDRQAPPPPPAQSQQYSQSAYAPVRDYGPPQQYAPPQGYNAPPPGYGQPQYGQPQYGQQPQSGGFLRSAMQTATGVAAGALAFQGIESLMHGFGGSGGGSGFSSGMGGGRPEEIVNNYYGDSSSGGHEKLSSDIEDRRGGSSFDDAVARDDHHDTKDGFADTDTDDSDPNNDSDDTADSSNFDDGSSFDDGSGSDDSSSDDSNY